MIPNASRFSLKVPVLLATALGAAAFFAFAGPLDPPAGPVASTYKTLAEVEPRIAVSAANTPGDADSVYRIARPGSYYLTDEVVGAAGKSGIEIASGGVTLDLRGFTLRGIAGAVDGISVPADVSNVAIHDGAFENWPGHGVNARLASVMNVHNLRASRNTLGGIWTGDWTAMRDCVAAENDNIGIWVGYTSTVAGCSSRDNIGSGIRAYPGSTLTDCASEHNGAGFGLFDGHTVTRCIAWNNTGDGFFAGDNVVFSECMARENGAIGIHAIYAAVIRGCSVELNGGDGVEVFNGSTVEGCAIHLNGGNGIVAIGLTTIRGNNVSISTLDGILITGGGNALIIENICTSNGQGTGNGAGIHTTTDGGNRIEGNTCNSNDRGIDIDGDGNLVIRNGAAGNTTNYSIVAGNRYGPIVNITATGTAAVTGNTAVSTVGTTDPWANFAH